MPTARQLMDMYHNGQIDYQSLFRQLVEHQYSDPPQSAKGYGATEFFERSEMEPDDDSFFWVESSPDNKLAGLPGLSTDEVGDISDAIVERHNQRGGG